MDALVTDLLRSVSLPGPAGDPTRPGSRRRRTPPEVLRALLRGAWPGGDPGSAAGGATVARRRSLYAYTAAVIVAAGGLLAWCSLAVPPVATIDPRIGAGTVLEGPSGGLLLWLGYGLLGSMRVLRAPGGTLMTFHMPFVGAAMVLGGPTAGAWVAMLSTIERRELESQPWYGILFNHAALALGAIAGGLATQAVAAMLGSDPGTTGLLGAAVAGTAVLAVVSIGLGVVTVVLRDDVAPRAFVELLVGQIGRITLIESALVVILAAAYAQVGWWSPLLVGAFVLLAWDNDPLPAPDPLTALQPPKGFARRLESGLGRMRRGLTPGATLLSMDLDLFGAVNNRYGHAVGDEVLREVGARLLAQARRPYDIAGRLGGDEMALFLPGLADPETAMRRADDVAAAVTAPIATSVGPVTIGVSIGVLVLRSWGGIASSGALLRHADQAMYHAKRSGSRIHLYDPAETAPFDEDAWLEARR